MNISANKFYAKAESPNNRNDNSCWRCLRLLRNRERLFGTSIVMSAAQTQKARIQVKCYTSKNKTHLKKYTPLAVAY